MRLLTKLQREILQSAVNVMDSHEIKQPIHCVMSARPEIHLYAKRYAIYSRQMYKLVDAGVLSVIGDDPHSNYVYVADYGLARRLLNGTA